MIFQKIKDAHEHYKYPGSYRHGTIVDSGIVLRSYSAGVTRRDTPYAVGKDIVTGDGSFYYMINNDTIREAYQETMRRNEKIRLFIKLNDGRVVDAGLRKPIKFYKGFVKLIR